MVTERDLVLMPVAMGQGVYVQDGEELRQRIGYPGQQMPKGGFFVSTGIDPTSRRISESEVSAVFNGNIAPLWPHLGGMLNGTLPQTLDHRIRFLPPIRLGWDSVTGDSARIPPGDAQGPIALRLQMISATAAIRGTVADLFSQVINAGMEAPAPQARQGRVKLTLDDRPELHKATLDLNPAVNYALSDIVISSTRSGHVVVVSALTPSLRGEDSQPGKEFEFPLIGEFDDKRLALMTRLLESVVVVG